MRHGIARALLRVRRQAAPDAQAGRPPDPRSADEGAQEVRAARARGPSSSTPSGRPVRPPCCASRSPGRAGTWGRSCSACSASIPKVQLAVVTSERLAGERLDKVYPHLRGLSDLVFQRDRSGAADRRGRPRLSRAAAHGVAAGGARAAAPRPQGHRPLRRLPVAGRLAVHDLVQGAPRGRRRAGGGRVRPARAAPQGDRGRLAGGLPGLLPDGRDPRDRAAAQERARARRRHRHRRQVRSDRRGRAGPQDRPDVPLHRGQRERPGLRHGHPSPHARDGAGALGAGGPAGRGGLHAASGAAQSRALHHGVGAAGRSATTTAELLALYREFYAGEPFVRVLDEGRAARRPDRSWAPTSAT